MTIKKKSKQAKTSRSIISRSLEMRKCLDTWTSTIKFKIPSLQWPRHGSPCHHPRPGQSFSSFASPQPSLQGLKTKLFTFIYSKNSDLSLDLTPVLFICSSYNSLQMFDVVPVLKDPLLVPGLALYSLFIPSSSWLIVVLLTTLENLVSLP